MLIARSTPAQNPRGLARRTSMASILGLLRGAGRAQPVEDQQARPDGDRRVGEIERPEMPAEGMEIEKIDDVAEDDPVPEIAERAPQYQRKAGGEQALARMPHEHHHDHGGGEDRDTDEKRALPAPGFREKAERGAAVVRKNQIEEAGNPARFADVEIFADHALARVIGDSDQRGDREPWNDALQAVHAKRRGSPGPDRFDTQRPQTPGCFGSAPTSGRQCQQRSHLGCLLGVARIASSAGLAAAVTPAREVTSTKRSSSPSARRSSSLSPAAAISTSAWSDEPISPAARCCSRSFCTSDRKSRSDRHFASSDSDPGTSGKR